MLRALKFTLFNSRWLYLLHFTKKRSKTFSLITYLHIQSNSFTTRETAPYSSKFETFCNWLREQPPSSQVFLSCSLTHSAFSRFAFPSSPRAFVKTSISSDFKDSGVPNGVLSPRRCIGFKPSPVRTSNSSYPALCTEVIFKEFIGWSVSYGQKILLGRRYQ